MKFAKTKKVISIILAASMIVLLTGCGTTGTEQTSGENGQKQGTESAATAAPETGTKTGTEAGTEAGDGKDSFSDLLDPASPVKVTFYSYSLGMAQMKDGMSYLIDTFNNTIGKEKGIVVEGVADDYTKWKTDVQAGNQVDIVQHPFGTLDASAQNMGIKAYEDVFPKEELESHLDGITENALSLGKINGKMYGLAFTFSTPILYINGKIFEDAGLDPNNPPKTWEEMLTYAKTIKEKTGKDGFGLTPDNSWITDGIIYTNGGQILNDDRTKAVFASDETVEAFKLWKKFYEEGVAALGTTSDNMQGFAAGSIGMHLQSSSVLSSIKAAAEAGGWKLYGAAMPGMNGREAVPVNSGSCLVVRPDNDQKAQAIWEFIKFVTGDEGYTIITSRIGYLPLRTYLADDPQYLKDYVDQNPLLRINIDQLSRIRAAAIWPGDSATETMGIFTNAVTEAISTDADIKTVLTEAQEEINAILE